MARLTRPSYLSRLREWAQSISESSQHALCTGLPVTQKTAPWIWRLTISSVKMTEGFSGGAGEECGPFIFMCRFMTCTLFVVAVVLLIFFPFLSLSSPATISNKPADGPGWPVAGTREAPLTTQRNEWLTAVYIHWWNKETLLGGEVPREAFTVPSSELHIGNM